MAIWKYMGPIRETSSSAAGSAKGAGAPPVLATAAAHWELQHKTLMQSPILQISWYGGNGAVAVVTEDGVTILTGTILTLTTFTDTSRTFS